MRLDHGVDKPLARQNPHRIWVLGFVSLLMDISSEMIHSLLPLFIVGTLGASVFLVGLIEGIAEATALIVKVFSGTLSDYLGKRKSLAVFGYALAALNKPLFAIAQVVSVGAVFTLARFSEAFLVLRAQQVYPAGTGSGGADRRRPGAGRQRSLADGAGRGGTVGCPYGHDLGVTRHHAGRHGSS